MIQRQSRRVFLDSSVYIAFLKGETIPAAAGMTRVELARLLFGAAEVGRISFFTSTISIVEVRRGVDSPAISTQTRLRLIDGLFDRTLTRFVEVDRDVALSARSMANEYNLKNMDAIQISSDRAANCEEMFIWDENVVRKFSERPLHGLRVCDPFWEGQMELSP